MNYICSHEGQCEQGNCKHKKIHDYEEELCSSSWCVIVGKSVKCVTLPELVLFKSDDIVVGM